MGSPKITVRGTVRTCSVDDQEGPAIGVELGVEELDGLPELEVRFEHGASWKITLSRDAGAFLAGLLADASGVRFDVSHA